MMGGPTNRYNAKIPPPINLNYESIYTTRAIEFKEIMDGMKEAEKGGLECVDKKILDKQKGLMSEVVKQVLKCVFSGQPISGISLPVRVFEPRSQLERMIDSFGFAPYFFKKAAQKADKLDRFKLVITSVVAGMYGSAKQLKPFNPLLGETYQGYFDDGSRLFCEHTSHHPPITNFHFQGPLMEKESNTLWEVNGFYEFTGNKDGGNFKVGQRGPNRLTFHDGHHIQWVNPVFKLSISGSRMMSFSGTITFWDVTENKKAIIFLDHTKKKGLFKTTRTGKIDDFLGVLYEIDRKKFEELNLHRKKIYEWEAPSSLSRIPDIETELCKIEGSWLRSISFDGRVYWQMNKKKYKIAAQRASKWPLPSDWRFREDLIWLKYQNEQYADAWKKELQKMQRLDRKWRKARKQ